MVWPVQGDGANHCPLLGAHGRSHRYRADRHRGSRLCNDCEALPHRLGADADVLSAWGAALARKRSGGLHIILLLKGAEEKVMKRIVLMGFMGAGKTTIGKSLAEAAGIAFVDTDERIENEQGRKISEIFAEDGETAFRDMETDLLKRLVESKEEFVLSIGGGMPVREENRRLLREIGTVIYLKTSKEEIIRRVSGDTARPLLQGGALEEKVTALMNAREHIYEETAHREVVTDGSDVSGLVEKIKKTDL